MTRQLELAVRLRAMRDFRPTVTPTLRPYRYLRPLPLRIRRAGNAPGEGAKFGQTHKSPLFLNDPGLAPCDAGWHDRGGHPWSHLQVRGR